MGVSIKDGELICPRCEAPMIYHASHEYWSCTHCLLEVWEDTERLKELRDETVTKAKREALRQLTHGHIMSVRAWIEPKPYGYVPGTRKSSGSKSGRTRKKPKKDQIEAAYQIQ